MEIKAVETTGGLSRLPHSPSQKASVHDLFTASYLSCIERMESRGCGWLSLAIRRAERHQSGRVPKLGPAWLFITASEALRKTVLVEPQRPLQSGGKYYIV